TAVDFAAGAVSADIYAGVPPTKALFAMADGAIAGRNAERAGLCDLRFVIHGIDSGQRPGILCGTFPVLLLLPRRTVAPTAFAGVPDDVLLDAFTGRGAGRGLCRPGSSAHFLGDLRVPSFAGNHGPASSGGAVGRRLGHASAMDHGG